MPALMYVAEHIGDFWTTLIMSLEFHPAMRDNVAATCANIPHRALAVLYEWYKRDPKNATKGALVDALRTIKRNDIADDIDMM